MSSSGVFSIHGCFSRSRDHTRVFSRGTRIWNLTGKPIELQVRVGAMLKKGQTLKPGSSKRVKGKSIYKTYLPNGNSASSGGGGVKGLNYYCDQTCQPYVWIHDSVGDFSRMVKQQYISLEDLRDCSEIKIFRDQQRGCISVRKKQRPNCC